MSIGIGGREICDACGEYSDECVCGFEREIAQLRAELAQARAQIETLTKLRSADEWHEDFGNVLWWRVPIAEPPYCGSPLDDDFQDDYYTHWSMLPEVDRYAKELDEAKATIATLKVYARHTDVCACLFAAKPCDCGYGRDVLFADVKP